MKKFEERKLYILISLLSFSNIFVGQHPPPPNGKRPPSPPGLPIDENVYVMLTLALIFGILFIYRHNINN